MSPSRLLLTFRVTLLVGATFGVGITSALAQTPASTCCACQKNSQSICVRFSGISSCSDLSGSAAVHGIQTGSNASLLTGFTCSPLSRAQCAIVAQHGQCTAPPISEGALQTTLQNMSASGAGNGTAGGATGGAGTGSQSAGTGAATGNNAPLPSIVPTLSIPIPGVTFTPATQSGDGVDVPFLAQYISGVYRYLLGISVLVATIMVVYGGFKYVVGATPLATGDGKKIIQDAIGGLVVLLCAHVILSLVDPELLNLKSLHLLSINSVGIEETGTMANLGAYGGEAGADPEDLCNIPNGGYFARMWQVCRGQDGPALDPRGQLLRLKEIVDIWKRIGIDEGGGVYVRGGNRSCTPRNLGPDIGQGHWVFKELHKFATKNPPQIDLNAIGLPAGCPAVIQAYDEEHPDASFSAACVVPAWDAYNRAVVSHYRAAGLYCADCILNVRNIYQCFGRMQTQVQYIADHVCHEPGSNGSIFNLQAGASAAQIDAALAQLRFGDGMVNGGHAWLYTGGAGLGYEIMEMGGTGYPIHSVGPNSSDAAKAHAGFSIHGGVGGMAVYASAADFVRQKVHSLKADSPHPCVSGYRILQGIPEDAYRALPSLPFTPFTPQDVHVAPPPTDPSCRQ